MSRLFVLLVIASVFLAISEALSANSGVDQGTNNKITAGNTTTPTDNPCSRMLRTADDISTADSTPDSSLDGNQNGNLKIRLLRTGGAIDGNTATEERGFKVNLMTKVLELTTKWNMPKTAQNMKLRLFREWLKERWDPTRVKAHLGMAGKSAAELKNNPKFKIWLDYSKTWRDNDGRYMA